jgi:hypothetical protein
MLVEMATESPIPASVNQSASLIDLPKSKNSLPLQPTIRSFWTTSQGGMVGC